MFLFGGTRVTYEKPETHDVTGDRFNINKGANPMFSRPSREDRFKFRSKPRESSEDIQEITRIDDHNGRIADRFESSVNRTQSIGQDRYLDSRY